MRAPPAPLQVLLMEAKPNAMFTDEQTAATLFLRYNQAVPCAECGKRSKHHWTVLYAFKATSMPTVGFMPSASAKVHMPLTPVCRGHLLKPAVLSTDARQKSTP